MSARARTRRSPARFKRNPAADYAPTLDLGARGTALWDGATGAIAQIEKLQRFLRGQSEPRAALPRALDATAQVIAAVIRPYAAYRKGRVAMLPGSDYATTTRALRAAWELAREIQRDARALAAAAPSPWHEHLDKRVAREHAAALASAIERLGAARDSFATARELLADHLGGGSVGQIKWGVVRLDAMLRRLGAPEGPRGRLALAQELLAQGIV